MSIRQRSSLAIVVILGLLAMLMPLSIDMYLPALPVAVPGLRKHRG